MNKSIFEIKGFDELQAKIKNLPDKVKRKEIIKILRNSAKSTVTAARAEAPKSERSTRSSNGKSGTLKKSIKVAVMRKSTVPMVVVGPRSSGKYDGFYGRLWVIPGHNIYRSGFIRNKKGKKSYNDSNATNEVDADPFMERAYAQTGGLVSRKATTATEKYIQKAIDRL